MNEAVELVREQAVADAARPVPPRAEEPRRRARWIGRIALYALTALALASGLAVVTSLAWLVGAPFTTAAWFARVHAAALTLGALAFAVLFVDLMLFHRFLVPPRDVSFRSLREARVHVALTAYNDEVCIADAVRDFTTSGLAHRVIVVDNDSADRTAEVARAAGADEVVVERRRGYGACCMRGMAEAAKGADVVVLCEGDSTFAARDIAKLLAYLENCDLVLGTRATQELREKDTQMDWLINPANQVVAKLIQTRFWGTRLTDVGCTYRAIRTDALRRLAPRLRVTGNHFSPHMFIEALQLRMRVIEVPVVFRKRAGVSKGVGSDKLKAARVAIRMLGLLYRA
jgi:hypothetical protein